jgi:uncharacterized iron-regulated membrane protein
MSKRLWQIHSWLGLIAGLGLLLIGITGSVLVFRNDVQALVNPKLLRVEPTPPGRLGHDRLLAAVVEKLPGYEVTGWQIQREPGFADLAYVIRHGTHEWKMVTVDPFTAEVLAGPMETSDTFVGWLLEFHYTFLGDHLGMLIAGLFAVLLCALGLTGVWLYRDFWRNFFTLRWRKSARIFCSDLHKMVGISSVAFNLILGFTGAYWNLPHAVEHLIEGEPECVVSGRLYGGAVSLDRMIAEAGTEITGFQANYISLPWAEGTDITLWGRVPSRSPLRSDYGSTVVFDAQTGAVKSSSDIRNAGAWAQIADTFYPLHFGNFGGLPVKLLWCLLGLSPGVLAVSGTVIWWQRNRRAASRQVVDGSEPSPIASPVPTLAAQAGDRK